VSAQELWGYYAHPSRVACRHGSPENGTPLDDRGGVNWGRVWGSSQPELDQTDALTFRNGDAAVTWRCGAAQLRFARTTSACDTLYYCVENLVLHFATRLPRLLSLLSAGQLKFNQESLADLLVFGRLLPPMTIFANIWHLAPGTSLAWSASHSNVPKSTEHMDWDWSAGWECSRLTSVPNPNNARFTDLPAPGEQPAKTSDLAFSMASSIDIFNEVPFCTSVLADPIAERGIVLFAYTLKFAKSTLNWDVTHDLLRDLHAAGTPSRRMNVWFILKPRWRAHFNSYWVEERLPKLLNPIASVLANALRWEPTSVARLLYVAPERRLQISMLAAARDKTVTIAGSEPIDLLRNLRAESNSIAASDVPASHVNWKGFSLEDPESGNLFANAVRLFYYRERLDARALDHYFALSPVAMNGYLKRAGIDNRCYLEDALTGLLSLQYLWRFAGRLCSAER
jgi:hypothetical protein